MHRILYISTVRAPFSDREMQALLTQSRKNNAAVDVTGLLLVGGRRFLQALEGHRDAIETLFDRISADPRHFAVVKLADGPIAERAFGQWSMGFQAGGDPGDGGDADGDIAAIIAPIADRNLRAYFAGFAEKHGVA